MLQRNVRLRGTGIAFPDLAFDLHPLERSTPKLIARQVHDRAPQVRLEGIGSTQVSEPTNELDERIVKKILRDAPITGQQIGETEASRSVANIQVRKATCVLPPHAVNGGRHHRFLRPFLRHTH